MAIKSSSADGKSSADARTKPPARRKKKDEGLSRDYIDRHLPEDEFSPRDFERVGELLLFARSVTSALMREAKKHPGVKKSVGPARIDVALTFSIVPEGTKGKGNCIRVGGYASGPADTIHIPCLVAEGRGRYRRDE